MSRTISPVDAQLIKIYLGLEAGGGGGGGGGNVTYNPATGQLEYLGSPISGVASYTWAQFTDVGFDLATARYVRVTDRHSTRDPAVTSGSLWFIDPLAPAGKKRQLYSDPLYFATAASAPDPIAYPGIKCFFANFGAGGGSDWISNGTVYRPKDSLLVAYMSTAGHTHSAAFATDEIAHQLVIPRDVNGNSLFGVGDVLSIDEFSCFKSANVDTFNITMRAGILGTISDLSVNTGTTVNPSVNWKGHKWQRNANSGANSVIERCDIDGFTALSGSSATAKAAADTLTGVNFDAAPVFVSLTYKVNTSTTDTALRSGYCQISMIRK